MDPRDVFARFLLLAAAQKFCIGPLIGKFFVFAIILGDLVRPGKVAGSDGEIAAFEKQRPGGAGAELRDGMGIEHRIGEIWRFLCQIQGADERVPRRWEQHSDRPADHGSRIAGVEGVVVPVGDKAAPSDPGAFGNQVMDHNAWFLSSLQPWTKRRAVGAAFFRPLKKPRRVCGRRRK